MISSVDGSLATKHWTSGPGNNRAIWGAAYAAVHNQLGCNAWLVGRVTMAEMMENAPLTFDPGPAVRPERPCHFAEHQAKAYAIAVDSSGRLRPTGPLVDGDHAVLLLGSAVSDAHLNGLAASGISYIVSNQEEVDLPAALIVLRRELGIERLLLEGGGGINGSFLAANLVDEISLIVAPAVDARAGKRTIFEAGEAGLAGKLELQFAGCTLLEAGMVHLRYVVRSSS